MLLRRAWPRRRARRCTGSSFGAGSSAPPSLRLTARRPCGACAGGPARTRRSAARHCSRHPSHRGRLDLLLETLEHADHPAPVHVKHVWFAAPDTAQGCLALSSTWSCSMHRRESRCCCELLAPQVASAHIKPAPPGEQLEPRVTGTMRWATRVPGLGPRGHGTYTWALRGGPARQGAVVPRLAGVAGHPGRDGRRRCLGRARRGVRAGGCAQCRQPGASASALMP